MPEIIEVDFEGAPPAQGGSFDHVPPGMYKLKVAKVDVATTTGGTVPGATQIRVALEVVAGESKGMRVGDSFVLPRPGTNDKKFGLQRFHAFLVAVGFKQQNGVAKVPLDRTVGREVMAEVRDKKMEAKGEYPERTISTPNAYFRVGSDGTAQPVTAEKPAAAASAQTPPPVIPPPAAAEEPSEELSEDDAAAVEDDLFSEE